MYIATKGERVYCVCDRCRKPYSFKRAKYLAQGMETYCREHGSQFYPQLPKKNVTH